MPSHYYVPEWLYCPDIQQIEYLRNQRKRCGQKRDELLAYQKAAGKDKDFDKARYLSGECAELMKEYRGWDYAIKWSEGNIPKIHWRHEEMSEQIAPYVDRAFGLMDLHN